MAAMSARSITSSPATTCTTRSASRTRPRSFNAIHDQTDQQRGFAYLSGIVDPTTRVSAIFGTSRSQFQIPNNPGQSPGLGLTVNGVTDFNSAQLNENQREITHYGILALQKKLDDIDFQVSAFNRYSSAYFTPDPLGDLLFNGIAQTAYRRSIATGVQGDGSYRLDARAHAARRVFHPGRALDLGDQLAGAAASTPTARRLPISRSRSSTTAARPAGSTASICRTSGRSRRS